MKKIKFLHSFLIVLLLLFIVNIFTGFYIYKNFEGITYDNFLIFSSFSILLILGLFYIQRALYALIKKGLFNAIASKRFRIAGLFFMLSSFGDAIISMLMISKVPTEASHYLCSNFSQDFLLMMIGFGLYILADFVENGNILKQENDLTI